MARTFRRVPSEYLTQLTCQCAPFDCGCDEGYYQTIFDYVNGLRPVATRFDMYKDRHGAEGKRFLKRFANRRIRHAQKHQLKKEIA
ncbi:TPA: hypothetical protein DF272_04215 [Candidatus Falkowbacteria bacterium]|nr:hypothetical protein [Candidatus Falkowbacteria bacterium]